MRVDASEFALVRKEMGLTDSGASYKTDRSQKEGFIVRMLMRVSIPVEAGNAAAAAGTLGTTVERILADLKPEAAYFFADDQGRRSGAMVFDMKDTSEIPALAEPWFLAFSAQVTFRPVMSPADLAKGAPGIEGAVKAFGKSAGR